MSGEEYEITTAGRDEVALAVEWAAAEGWNPGLADADCYFTADPQGFLVGLLDGEPVATISAVRYDGFGFVGFYIVRPDRRGRGLGWRIWQAGMARLQGCNVGLDGVLAQQDNYRKSGFNLAWRNIRHQGVTAVADRSSEEIVSLLSLSFEQVAQYDRPFFPAVRDRDAFLRRWLVQPGATALGVLRDGCLTGYGVVRPCRVGHKIGPLYADDATAAEALFQALAAAPPPGQPLFLDLPEPNGEALALARRHGMEPMFETARMYTGLAPALPVNRLFGVTSFEIG